MCAIGSCCKAPPDDQPRARPQHRPLRALRLLPAQLRQLPGPGQRDGLAPGPDPCAQGDRSRRADARCHGGQPFRQLPGLPGLRQRLPLGGALRPAARSHPAQTQRARAAQPGPAAVAAPAVWPAALPGTAAGPAAAAAGLCRHTPAGPDPAHGPAPGAGAPAGGHGTAAAAPGPRELQRQPAPGGAGRGRAPLPGGIAAGLRAAGV